MTLDVKNFSTLKIKIRASWSLPFGSNDSGEREGASELLAMFWIWILDACV